MSGGDAAILRVVLEDGGGNVAGTSSQSGSGAPSESRETGRGQSTGHNYDAGPSNKNVRPQRPTTTTGSSDTETVPLWSRVTQAIDRTIAKNPLGRRVQSMVSAFGPTPAPALPSVQAVPEAEAAKFVGPLQVARAGPALAGAARAGSVVSGVAMGAGAAAMGIAALTAAVIQLNNTMRDRANELRNFDPRIAGAVARTEVRATLADLREARMLGGRYAALERANSDIEIAFRGLMLPLKEAALRFIVPLAEGAAKIANTMPSLNELLSNSLAFAEALATKDPQKLIRAIAAAVETGTRAANRKVDDLGEANDLLERMLSMGDHANIPNYNRGHDPIGGASKAKLNIPAFANL